MSNWLVVTVLLVVGQAGSELPRVTDPRLRLQEFASHPEIVTPVGLDIDSRGRVYVVESHTHFPPPNYAGPKGDRIRVFEDVDGDGKSDRVTNFYEGLTHTMNLAIHPQGAVWIATRSEIFTLEDHNGDGTADSRTRIAHLETAGNYPHNGLSGFAFDHAGYVYFGFGENLGADYKLIGEDGTTLAGGGEGGNIYRCRVDGSKLERVATGFWNPFHLAFDAYGRLFAVDNDPDSRPPCRLLHIVPGGDYGYRFRNGRRGTHPFTSWNGELPGTLPMVAGTGEAPSGMVSYESDGLPGDYAGRLLVTSWGDHRLDSYQLEPRGASFVSTAKPIVVGGENFRPVGIAVAPDGSVFFSDWVDKSYQLHGKGRIWKLSLKNQADRPQAQTKGQLESPNQATREQTARRMAGGWPKFQPELVKALDSPRAKTRALVAQVYRAMLGAKPTAAELMPLTARLKVEDDPQLRALLVRLAGPTSVQPAQLTAADSAELRAAILEVASIDSDLGWIDPVVDAMASADPFVRHAATQTLSRVILNDLVNGEWEASEPPLIRQQTAVMLRQSGKPEARKFLPELLKDEDPGVRFLAVQWIGEERLKEHRAAIETLLSTNANSRLLFEACLAALERLDGTQRQVTDEWRGDQYVAQLLAGGKAAPAVKRQALRSLRADHPILTLDLLQSLVADPDAAVRLEAIRSLRESPHAGRLELLVKLATDRDRPELERAEATVGISGDSDAARAALVDLALADSAAIAGEALRSLRGAKLSADERQRLDKARAERGAAWSDLARVALEGQPSAAPSANELAAWIERAKGEGSAAAGERIFYHSKSVACSRCHEYDGRGGVAGPDLTPIAKTFTLERLVESLVQPSREIAPHFVPWTIETTAGQVRNGLLVGEEVDGTQRYVDEKGVEFRLKPAEIESRKQSSKSIMPDGLPAQLTPQELRDLIAFLRRR